MTTKPTKKQMHEETLLDFLEGIMKLSDMKHLLKVDQTCVGGADGLDRYRINVWKAVPMEGWFMPKVYISHSYYVHYETKDKTVTDRTVKVNGLRLEKSLLS